MLCLLQIDGLYSQSGPILRVVLEEKLYCFQRNVTLVFNNRKVKQSYPKVPRKLGQ